MAVFVVISNVNITIQEEEISLFNKKKAAVQAQRAQTEREQLASSKPRKR